MFTAILSVALIGGGEAASFGHHNSCCGGCSGCFGGSYGCSGGKHHGHHGCCGGYSSCFGGCYGCSGGHGHKHHKHSCCGCCGAYYGCMGYYGGLGCYGGYGFGGVGCVGGTVAPITNTPVTTTPVHKAEAAAPATIVVSVPADAKVTVDGASTTSTSARRVYVSPSLDAGAEYQYTLQADFNQDGKSISVKKVVSVRAGEQTEVDLNANDAGSVASR